MLKTLKNNDGLILVLVLMIVIVMTTLTLSLLSINMSQVSVAEEEVKRLQSEAIASGMMELMFARQQSNMPGTSLSNSQTFGSTTFNSTVTTTNVAIPDPLVGSTINATVVF